MYYVQSRYVIRILFSIAIRVPFKYNVLGLARVIELVVEEGRKTGTGPQVELGKICTRSVLLVNLLFLKGSYIVLNSVQDYSKTFLVYFPW